MSEQQVKRVRPLYRELVAQVARSKRIAETLERERAAGRIDQVEHWREMDTQCDSEVKALVDMLPSGSGIDCGTKLDANACKADRLVFTFSYHHMDENGMYCGWTEHTLTVVPSFDGIDLRISGRNRNDIKEYLYEMYHYALTQDVDIG